MSWSNVLRDQRQNLALISSWASQVRLGKVRDLIREAEYEIEKEENRVEEMEDKRNAAQHLLDEAEWSSQKLAEEAPRSTTQPKNG